MKRLMPFLLLLSLIFVSCAQNPTAANEPAPAQPTTAPTEAKAATQPEPTQEPTTLPEPTAVPTDLPAPEALAPEPQVIKIESFDGKLLDAIYYPAAVNPAPIVVWVHQYNFDQTEWQAIAPWLQNRGQIAPTATLIGNPLASPIQMEAGPWFDSSWFPPIPDGMDVAVLTVTLRECEGSCSGRHGPEWIQDVTSTLIAASEMEGVDSEKVLAVGTSIGADGVADGCLAYQESTGRNCLAVLSSSPGDYLGVPYNDTIASLTEKGTKALCFASEGDQPSYTTCKSVPEDTPNFSTHYVPGYFHGIYAIDPQVEEPWLQPMLNLFMEVLP